MNSPAQSTLLLRSTLDELHYTESLLARALELGMIDREFLSDLQRRFGHLLRRQCQAFTGGRSASMRREAVESLGQSVVFTLDMFAKSLEPVDALAALQNRPLEHCHAAGRKQVDSMVRAAELLHLSELRRELPVNTQLRSTFIDGIGGFFRLYNPEYGAHEIHITADYPVLIYPSGLQGIEFILCYLDGFCMENRLLRLFGAEKVHRILTRYAVYHNTTARELCDNLLLIVLAFSLNGFPGIDSLLDGIGCRSEALRGYAVSAAEAHASDIRHIQKLSLLMK